MVAIRNRNGANGIAVVSLALLFATPGLALEPRTFVASYGSDANSCALATPCRSFAAAFAQTADNGEVVAIDSAGYGAVELTRPVSIVAAPGIHAGITVRGSQEFGIRVDTAGSIALKGISITGGKSGLLVVNGAVDVHRMDVAEADNGIGVIGGRAVLRDVVVRDAATGLTFRGSSTFVHVDGATVMRASENGAYVYDGATATLARVTVVDSRYMGINLGGVRGSVTDCTIVQSQVFPYEGTIGIFALDAEVEVSRCAVSGASIAYLAKGNFASMAVSDSSAARTSALGLSGTGYLVDMYGTMIVTRSHAAGFASGFASSDGTKLRVESSTATRNSIGFNASGGLFESRQNNTVRGNAIDTTGTITGFGGI